MSKPVQPSDLYNQLGDALGDLRDVRRAVTQLSREYAGLDAADLAVDELGEELDPATALALTRSAIADLSRALDAADATFDPALRYRNVR